MLMISLPWSPKPGQWGGKSKRKLHGDCCCQDHCNLAMNISSKVWLAIYEKEAFELREVAQAEFDGEELIKCEGGISARTNLDVVK